MSQINKKIAKVARKTDRKIDRSPSKTDHFILLTLALFLVVIVMTLLSPSYAQTATDETIASLTSRLTSLENLQSAMVSTSRGAFEQMNYIFTIVAAFFGLFALFFAYRQLRADSNREERDQEMRSLVASFQQNITTISSLIGTLEQTFKYREQIEEKLTLITQRAANLELQNQESYALFKSNVDDLNSEAVKLFDSTLDRNKLSFEENIKRLDLFSTKMNSAETARDVKSLLNPICYYIRGLSNITVYQYDSAINDFDISSQKGRAELVAPKLSNYAEQDGENIQKYLKEMLVLSIYFQGMSYKNIEKYQESRTKFQEAISRNPRHLASKTYILQVMYFDKSVPFKEIETEYDTTIQEFKQFETEKILSTNELRKAFSVLKINQGNMYLKKIIPIDFRKGYEIHENQEKALKYYWEAYDYSPSDLAAFSVAQAMEGLGPSDRRGRTPADLYKEVIISLKRRIAEDHDRLYSVMLYYMLAICSRKLSTSPESAEVFLSQARHSLREIPSNVTCFSPISKIRLPRTEILKEMENFEKYL
jgi:tetratricopeptide (TPR) repeat protein